MTVRLCRLWLFGFLLFVPSVHAQDALPRHLQIEPITGPARILGVPGDQWSMLYGGRMTVTFTPSILLSGGYWPKQTVGSFRAFSEAETRVVTYRQWTVALRMVTPVAPTHGIFGTVSIGAGGLRTERYSQSGPNMGAHLEYWIAPFLLLRSGVDVTWPDDGLALGFQVGTAVVPFRW